MELPRVFVITCNKYNWLLRPYAYLFNKYYGQEYEVVYGTDRKPQFGLPDNFTYFNMEKDYPSNEWSNSLMRMLDRSPDEFIILMLEDYWLTRAVDLRAIYRLSEYMRNDRSILRFDLTDDRQYNGKAVFAGYIGEYDIVETPPESEYNMSLQAGIFSTELLRELLEPGKDAWQVEIHTQPPDTMRVLGTRQRPMRYANALLKGETSDSQLEQLRPQDKETITKWMPKEYLTDELSKLLEK